MKKFFNFYQYIAPIILFPLAYLIWYNTYNGNHQLIILTLSIPILFAYIIPNLGANVFQLWEFDTKFKMKNIRPHHGFLFGSATSVLVWICMIPSVQSIDLIIICRTGFIVGSLLAFWNWLYDLYAIKSGFLKVYNLAYHKGLGAGEIALDYAPIFFGIFGFCYGASLQINEYFLLEKESWNLFWLLLFVEVILIHIFSVAGYIVFSYIKTGTFGLKSYKGIGKKS